MSLYSIELRGKEFYWSIESELSDEAIEDLRENGVKISKLINTIPTWVPAKYIYHYIYLQDIFNFKIPRK